MMNEKADNCQSDLSFRFQTAWTAKVNASRLGSQARSVHTHSLKGRDRRRKTIRSNEKAARQQGDLFFSRENSSNGA
jgi:hypothetical protein